MKNEAMNTSATNTSGLSESTARFWLGVGIPAAAIATAVVSFVATRADLPSRVATHFDGSGTPDGSMTPAVFLVVTLALTVAGVVGLIWLARSTQSMLASAAPIVGFLGGFFAALGAAIATVTFWSQRGLDSWEDAGNVATLVIVPLLAAVLIGGLAARAASALPAAAAAAPAAPNQRESATARILRRVMVVR